MLSQFSENLNICIKVVDNGLFINDEVGIVKWVIDELAYEQAFAHDEKKRWTARWLLWEISRKLGVYPASLYELYEAKKKGAWEGIVVPTVEICGMAYDTARAIFKAAKSLDTCAFVFDLALRRLRVKGFCPSEYVSSVLAAAVKEGHSGPVFFQLVDCWPEGCPPEGDEGIDIERMKQYIKTSLEAGIYNFLIGPITGEVAIKGSADPMRDGNSIAANVINQIKDNQPAGIETTIGLSMIAEENPAINVEKYYSILSSIGNILQESKGISKVCLKGIIRNEKEIEGELSRVRKIVEWLNEVIANDRRIAGFGIEIDKVFDLDVISSLTKIGVVALYLNGALSWCMLENQVFPEDLRNELNGSISADEANCDIGTGLIRLRERIWKMDEWRKGQIMDAVEDYALSVFKRCGSVRTSLLMGEIMKVVEVRKVPADFHLLDGI